jgi:hypothetical protein
MDRLHLSKRSEFLKHRAFGEIPGMDNEVYPGQLHQDRAREIAQRLDMGIGYHSDSHIMPPLIYQVFVTIQEPGARIQKSE